MGSPASVFVAVDHDLCLSAGVCVRLVPDVFEQDEDDGTAVVLVSDPPASSAEALLAVARSCPSGAISIVVEAGVPDD